MSWLSRKQAKKLPSAIRVLTGGSESMLPSILALYKGGTYVRKRRVRKHAHWFQLEMTLSTEGERPMIDFGTIFALLADLAAAINHNTEVLAALVAAKADPAQLQAVADGLSAAIAALQAADEAVSPTPTV